MRVRVPCWAPAVPPGEGRVEVAGAGLRHPLVLDPLDVGVDGRAVHHDWSRAAGPGSMASPPPPPRASWGRRAAPPRPPGHPGRRAAVEGAQRRPPRRPGPAAREATVTGWPASTRCRVMGRPMAPSPMNPSCMVQTSSWIAFRSPGAGRWSPAGSGRRRRELRQPARPCRRAARRPSPSCPCRSPRPANGSRAKAASARPRSPGNAASHRQLLDGHVAAQQLGEGRREPGPGRARAPRCRRSRRSTPPPPRRAGRGTGRRWGC